ncbi:MAG: M48 family metallopeptidase [Steroidobacter sp.]
MNFFTRQAETRRLSRRLVALFAIAVIAVIAAVDLVVLSILASTQHDSSGLSLPTGAWLAAHPGALILTTLSVLGVIGLSSLYKTSSLNAGGGVVARSLGGVRVSADTTDPQERRLLNVVEEMAIASGVPMPEVYLLEQESGINAFAAGHNPSNAAVAVTRGALATLNRAELQGVIAHEFSHILNGDMRLNVRLMGLLFGLLVIAIIARTILRFAPRGRSSKKGGGAVAAIMLAAVAILVIGYVGLFFGRLIQAAMSRSRESLADASAIQFTRDPSGLRGALVKIGAASSGSSIGNPEGEEVAHMLFAPGMRRLFATHPSLTERLKAIDPRFDAKEIDEVRARLAAAPERETTEPVEARTSSARLDDLITLPATAPGMIAGLVGNPRTAHMQVARQIRKSLPSAVVAAGAHPASARALLLAFALDVNTQVRDRQKRFIAQQFAADVVETIDSLQADIDRLEPEQRIPALLRAFPALRQLTREERLQLMSALNGLLQREGDMSLQSYVLRKLAQVQLHDEINPAERKGRAPLSAVQSEIQVLFSVLAQHGHLNEAAARRAYEIGVHHLYPRERPAYGVPANWAPPLDAALSRLDQLAPVAKEQLLEAMTKTVMHDAQLTIGEAELLRAVCATLHCPLPPLVGGAASTHSSP